LPANGQNGSNGRMAGNPPPVSHNTLPARVNGGPNGNVTSGRGPVSGPTGRHFKPFDHRKMNPMAEIQVQYSQHSIFFVTYESAQ
jgi:hypothetical protein